MNYQKFSEELYALLRRENLGENTIKSVVVKSSSPFSASEPAKQYVLYGRLGQMVVDKQ